MISHTVSTCSYILPTSLKKYLYDNVKIVDNITIQAEEAQGYQNVFNNSPQNIKIIQSRVVKHALTGSDNASFVWGGVMFLVVLRLPFLFRPLVMLYICGIHKSIVGAYRFCADYIFLYACMFCFISFSFCSVSPCLASFCSFEF